MGSLDGKTLEAIAELICGDTGPFYRRGFELPVFFRNAGLSCPDHDGSTRKWWALDRLRGYNETPAYIEKVITRLASPKEYAAQPEVVNEVIDRLNRILSVEGLKIVITGVTPAIKAIAPSVSESRKTTVIHAQATPDFHGITGDPDLSIILASRWNEASNCLSVTAYLAAIILLGSVLEGVLLAFVNRYPSDANKAPSAPKDKNGRVKAFNHWTLANLIDVAHDCSWIQLDAKKFSSVLREYRNLVHPWEQKARRETPDEDTVRICAEVARAAINDLERFAGI